MVGENPRYILCFCQVHGLLGRAAHWHYLAAQLREQLADDGVLLYISQVNEHTKVRGQVVWLCEWVGPGHPWWSGYCWTRGAHILYASASTDRTYKRCAIMIIALVAHANLITNPQPPHTQTYQGIDVCGDRLVEELGEVLATHPSLQEISFVGHSMGGLIARYAAGQLFDPETRLIADRLRPVHYVSLATPHLGCDLQPGICEVPLVSWLCAPPVVGRAIGFVVRPFVSGVVCRHLRRSGRQFFLTDGDDGVAPLIERLAKDEDARGGRYLAALAAFETRTLYANVSGDHLVSWTNASLRERHELPQIAEARRACGVVREEPLWRAWDKGNAPSEEAFERGGGERNASAKPLRLELGDAASRADKHEEHEHEQAELGSLLPVAEGAIMDGHPSPTTTQCNVEDAGAISDSTRDFTQRRRAATFNAMLCALRTLQWRRVDVSFAKCLLPRLAHQHIQMQRSWLNGAGKGVAQHVAASIASMERARKGRGC